MLPSFPRILPAGLILLLGGLAHAADRQIQATWEQLPSRVLGQKISTVLTDSTLVEGRVVAVMPEVLVVKVSKTTAPARFRGTANIPRELVSSVRVSRPGWKWRIIGPIVGGLGLAAAGGLIGDHVDPHGFIISDGAANGVAVGFFSGIAVGYIIGHFADQHREVISVVR